MKTREEQIEEMAKAMGDFELKDTVKCDIELSEHLFAKGYRKHSDTVREFVEKLKSADSKPLAWEYGEGYMDCIRNAVSIAKEYGVEVEE